MALGAVGDVVGVAGALVRGVDDVGRRTDQPTPKRGIGHDLGVVGGSGRGRHLVDQIAQVQRATHIVQDAGAPQGIDGRDDVDGLALGEEHTERLIDLAVGRTVEVVCLEDLDDVGHRFGGQEHRAQDRSLGIEVLWGHPVPGDLDDFVSDARHSRPLLHRSNPTPDATPRDRAPTVENGCGLPRRRWGTEVCCHSASDLRFHHVDSHVDKCGERI